MLQNNFEKIEHFTDENFNSERFAKFKNSNFDSKKSIELNTNFNNNRVDSTNIKVHNSITIVKGKINNGNYFLDSNNMEIEEILK